MLNSKSIRFGILLQAFAQAPWLYGVLGTSSSNGLRRRDMTTTILLYSNPVMGFGNIVFSGKLI